MATRDQMDQALQGYFADVKAKVDANSAAIADLKAQLDAGQDFQAELDAVTQADNDLKGAVANPPTDTGAAPTP